MNRGNQMKAYRKYILSLPVIETREYDNGAWKTELRQDPKKENFYVVIRYEEKEWYDSITTEVFPNKEELIEKYM